ncbi:MAG TPA: hypothetical protein VF779_10385 [Pyrinomonadaceae bacterium]
MLSDPQGCGQLENRKDTHEPENQTASLFQIISEAGFGVEPNGTRSHAIPCTGLQPAGSPASSTGHDEIMNDEF